MGEERYGGAVVTSSSYQIPVVHSPWDQRRRRAWTGKWLSSTRMLCLEVAHPTNNGYVSLSH